MRTVLTISVLVFCAGCASTPKGRVVDLTVPPVRPEKITETRSDGSQTIYDFTR